MRKSPTRYKKSPVNYKVSKITDQGEIKTP